MSAAYAKGIEKSLPNAQISYDRYHVVALANKAMDEVRKAEWKDDSQRVLEQLGELDPRERRSIMWGMRRNRRSASVQFGQSRRACTLKIALPLSRQGLRPVNDVYRPSRAVRGPGVPPPPRRP
jgi:transposase